MYIKQFLDQFEISDDDYFDFGGNNETLVKNLIGPELYHQNRVGFEIEFTGRNWQNQTQIIRIYLIGEPRDIFWLTLQYSPK